LRHPTRISFGRFQFDQFDQRLWELYLWAAFRELGLDVVQTEAPDFQCSAPGIAFTVEATTAAASTAGPLAKHPDPGTPEEMAAFLANYMPMKFGSCLTGKLKKKDAQGRRYWERDDSKGKPFRSGGCRLSQRGDRERASPNDVYSVGTMVIPLWSMRCMGES
jgi:hypothetical protein